MKKFLTALKFGLLVVFFSGSALAEGMPSAKSAVAMSGIALIESTAATNSWQPILRAAIKVPEKKDLAIAVSLECGLYTQTEVKSKGGAKDTSSADASVKVRVAVNDEDGNLVTYAGPAAASGVVFARRSQQLSAVFQGLVDGCMTVNELGEVIIDTECLLPEELELVLDTMNANAFNFLAPNLNSGTYQLVVEAEIDSGSSAQAGTAEALATIGLGSMIVEEIRMVNGASGATL